MPPSRRKSLDESFEEVASAKPTPGALKRDDVQILERDNVTTSKRETMKTRPHVSLYVSSRVQRAVKQLALDRNQRPHEIYVMGLRRLFEEHGLDFDALNDDE